MIIGKDRTNMPVTSSEELDAKFDNKAVIGTFNTNSFAKQGDDNFYSTTISVSGLKEDTNLLIISWGNSFAICPLPVSGAGHSMGALVNSSYITQVVRIKYELKDDNTKLDIALDSSFTPVSNYTGYIVGYRL